MTHTLQRISDSVISKWEDILGYLQSFPPCYAETNLHIRRQSTSAHIHEDGYYQSKQNRTSVAEDVKELEPLCIVGRNVKWYDCCEKQYAGSSQN